MEGNTILKYRIRGHAHNNLKHRNGADRVRETDITPEILESLKSPRIDGEVLSTSVDYLKSRGNG